MFTAAAVTGNITARLGREVDVDDVDDAVTLLHRFNPFAVDEATATVCIHGLVQRAVREATHPDHQPALATTVAGALREVWPEVERGAGHQMLRANTTALHGNAGVHPWTDAGGRAALFQAGHSLGRTGFVRAAMEYFQQLHTSAADRLRPDDPDTLSTRSSLAWWRGQGRDPVGAASP